MRGSARSLLARMGPEASCDRAASKHGLALRLLESGLSAPPVLFSCSRLSRNSSTSQFNLNIFGEFSHFPKPFRSSSPCCSPLGRFPFCFPILPSFFQLRARETLYFDFGDPRLLATSPGYPPSRGTIRSFCSRTNSLAWRFPRTTSSPSGACVEAKAATFGYPP